METPYLLHYAPDNASLIIRLALEELDLPYETVLVDRSREEQRREAYLALNPHGRIPVLETPDGVIFETGAILLWLADRYGMLAPGPEHPERGDFLKWLFFVSNTLHAQLTILFYTDRYVSDEAALHDLRDNLAEHIKQHLLALDELAATKPDWFGAEAPSMLDLYVVACLRWLGIYPTDMPRWFDLGIFPNLARLAIRIEKRPSVAALSVAEGLGLAPFTSPVLPNPPEGSAL
jgi:glutathione S-transferase